MKTLGFRLALLLIANVAWAIDGDWRLFVPGEPVMVQGVYADHNQAIVQDTDFSEMNLNDLLPFTIPDQTAVSAFGMSPNGTTHDLWLSFKTPVASYLPGDVIRCAPDLCELVFRGSDVLGVGPKIKVDALDVSENGLLNMSWDVPFIYQSELIKPQNLYLLLPQPGNQFNLNLQTEGGAFGIGDTSSMSKYSRSFDLDNPARGFGAPMMFRRNTDVFFPNEMMQVNDENPAGYFGFGLSNDIRSLIAFDSLESGVAQFLDANSMVEVSENGGNTTIDLQRLLANEGYVEFAVTQVGGNAQPGIDYSISNATVAWTDADNADQSMQITLINNASIDGTRNAVLQIFPSSQFAVVDATANTIELRILDDDDDLIFEDGFE